jgi:hypothetical protein
MNNKMKRFPTFKEATSIRTTDTDFIQFMNRDAHKEILEAIISSNYYNKDNGYINFLIETVLNNNLHHKVFEGTLSNDEMYPIILERYISEGKIKDWFDKKIETAKGWIEDGAEKAKEAGVKVIAKLKSFGDVVKIIKDSVAGFLKAAWDLIKKSVTSNLSQFKDDLVSKWKHWAESDEENVVGEVKNFGKMSTAAVSWATKGFPNDTVKAASTVGNEDSETQDKEEKPKEEKPKEESYTYEEVLEKSLYIALSELIKEDSSILDEAIQFNELMNTNSPENTSILEAASIKIFDSLDEADHAAHGFQHIEIPFIGKVVHKLAHVKPFVYLTNIEHWVGEKVNNVFHKISIWINKFANGPAPYKYNYLGQCAAFTVGAKIKSGLKELAVMIGEKAIGVAIASMVPGISWVLTVLKTIASGIWYVEVGQLGITAAAGATQKATKAINKKPEEKPEEETKEKPEEEPQ